MAKPVTPQAKIVLDTSALLFAFLAAAVILFAAGVLNVDVQFLVGLATGAVTVLLHAVAIQIRTAPKE